MSTALLVARLAFGLGIAAHGLQKLVGWFGGYGLGGTAQFFEVLGLRPGRLFAITAALGETVGGTLLVLGLFGPVGPALVIVVMIVAAIAVHAKHGFFVGDNGIELPMLYAMGVFVLAFTGPGAYSCDRVLGLLSLSGARNAWIAVGAAVVVAALNLAARRPPAQPSAKTV